MIAVVTGSTSGIGEAITSALTNRRNKVVAVGRSANDKYAPSELIYPFSCDLTVDGEIEKILEYSLSELGAVDAVFVNAGVIESGDIENVDIDKICSMVRLKVESGFRLVYTFAKYFKSKGRGHIFITSSVLGTKTRESSGAYAGCNYALEALAEALRMELSDTDVKITCIEPGLVQTNLHSEWDVHPKELLNISHALQPQDIADAVIEVLEKPDHIRIPRIMILPKGHAI